MDTIATVEGMQHLQFQNRVTNALPVDPSDQVWPRQVPGACFSEVMPKPVRQPKTIAVSREMIQALGFEESIAAHDDFAEVFSGNRVLPGMRPYAWCYGGHQFGNWAGQLGDGRAINLGDVKAADGRNWVLQLKGAGLTPYSRMADGRAVMRSSVREFLCSEAMHHLGVPTTRALSLVATGEEVIRDMFYDGHPEAEPGAVVCRAASSFVRFGNFEIHAARDEIDILRQLANFTIKTEFPEFDDPEKSTQPELIYSQWFDEVCRRTADMIVHWMRVGFVHGVMNTDNMSILGLTIDYGPYGWMEDYDLSWTPNTTDAQGRRYSYGNQPRIALWNLNKLANALYPLIKETVPLEASLQGYADYFNVRQREMLAAKMGIDIDDHSDELVADLFNLLQKVETDMTLFFRALATVSKHGDQDALEHFRSAYYREEQLDSGYREQLDAWLSAYRSKLKRDGMDDRQRQIEMNRVNPKYVLRNYLAQLAIDKAEHGDGSEVDKLLDVLRNPYDEQPENESYANRRPEWARQRPGCSMLSCSS